MQLLGLVVAATEPFCHRALLVGPVIVEPRRDKGDQIDIPGINFFGEETAVYPQDARNPAFGNPRYDLTQARHDLSSRCGKRKTVHAERLQVR